jgi:hypothetical protein
MTARSLHGIRRLPGLTATFITTLLRRISVMVGVVAQLWHRSLKLSLAARRSTSMRASPACVPNRRIRYQANVQLLLIRQTPP